MDSLDEILTCLAATLDVELQEGRSTVELSPETTSAFLSGQVAAKSVKDMQPELREMAAYSGVRRASAAVPAAVVAEPPAPSIRPKPLEVGGSSLEEIAARIAGCTRCELHATRTQTVPGVGRLHPDILFIGEAPGADEDLKGIPFVGRAGQLLTRMIEAMGYARDEVYIANILKCRPPSNRPPSPGEMELCLPYLRAQIAIIQPKTIVALGTTAVQGLLRTTAKISQLRNRWHAFEGIPLMPTFHPSYLLRFPAAKRDVWVDLQDVLKKLGRTPPPRTPSPTSTP